MPASASASPAVVTQASDTPIDAKYAAAAVLGWVPREEVTLSDRDFVSVLWEKASERHNSEVKEAARLAFSDATDAEAASAQFIEVGIFEANNRDIARKARRAELDTMRLRAAQEINWVPATNAERSTMLDQTLPNFLQEFWRRAATWPEVKAATEAVMAPEATDEQRLTFLTTGLFAKAQLDRENEVAQGNADAVAKQRAAAVRSAKEKAIAVALRRSATPFELDELDDRELVYLVSTDSKGRNVLLAATVAYNDPSPDVWLEFFFTGVHLANKVDIDERDLAEARANETKVRDIMYAAEADGYQPTVVSTSKAALAGAALARSQYLLAGYSAAVTADTIRPLPNRVVMLQAAGTNGCIAESLGWFDEWINAAQRPVRVDPCNENLASQRWVLQPQADGRYRLSVDRLSRCLRVVAGKETLDGAPIADDACRFPSVPAEIWDLVDSGAGTVEIRNATSNKVVSTVAGSKPGYLSLVQNPTAHSAAQQWRLIDPSHQAKAAKAPRGQVRIKGTQSGRCVRPIGALDQPGKGALAGGVRQELRDCTGGIEYIYDVLPVDDNRFELRNRASQFCLVGRSDMVGTMGAEGMFDGTCGTAKARWTVMSDSPSGGFLRSASTGLYLSVPDKAVANATVVTQSDFADQPSKRWILEPVAPAAAAASAAKKTAAAENATAPTKKTTVAGNVTALSGATVVFQPVCQFVGLVSDLQGKSLRMDPRHATKGLIRADGITVPVTQERFEMCALRQLTNSSYEVTLKSTLANAWVRESTNSNPLGLMVADRTKVEEAGKFIFQSRSSTVANRGTINVLQSTTSKKYAVDSGLAGANAGAYRFSGATPARAAEIYAHPTT